LSAMDRHVICNMGAELGATSSLFPADEEVRRWLKTQQREEDFVEIKADANATYDVDEEIDLSKLEPLVALPSNPDRVVPVREVAGAEIYQAYVGSSANPGYRDFAMAAEIVKGKQVHPRVSFDVSPTSRQVLENLVADGHLLSLIQAGARIHQAGCNGCIGMGQAPATDSISLRTVPRNFPGRSGTLEDKVYLVSPETAAASALTGKITDPRTLGMRYPRIKEPEKPFINLQMLLPPPTPGQPPVELVKGPNIAALPDSEPLPNEFAVSILLKLGDNISTDEIMPAGAQVLPYRSNIPKIAEFSFERVDPTYAKRAFQTRDAGHAIIGGRNYGQGSSREHAALGPRYLGLRLVIAKSLARIHRQNLSNFGVLPLTFDDPAEYDRMRTGDILRIRSIRDQLKRGETLEIECDCQDQRESHTLRARHQLTARQVRFVLIGGLINWMKERLSSVAV
ncbi:MAG TPA: aconitase family protein, partial [Planctomycetota bacterium]|nr:aconitase family protein [Planctomycetota bacterium]